MNGRGGGGNGPLHRSNSIAVFCCRFNILLCRIYFKCTMTTWHTNVRVRVIYIYIYRAHIHMLADEDENGARRELGKNFEVSGSLSSALLSF